MYDFMHIIFTKYIEFLDSASTRKYKLIRFIKGRKSVGRLRPWDIVPTKWLNFEGTGVKCSFPEPPYDDNKKKRLIIILKIEQPLLRTGHFTPVKYREEQV